MGEKAMFIAGGVCVVMAILFAVGGVVVPAVTEEQLDDGLEEMLAFFQSTDSAGYKMWQNNTQDDVPPLYQKYVFFNYTDIDNFLKGELPVTGIQETRPYVFRDNQVNFDALFDGDLLSYKRYEYYTWETEQNQGLSLSDEIITPNFALLTVFQQLTSALGHHAWVTLLEGALAKYAIKLDHEDVFIRRNISDLLLGYEDPLLKKLAPVANFLGVDLDPVVPGLLGNQTSYVESAKTEKFNTINTSLDFSPASSYTYYTRWEDQEVIEWAWPLPITGSDGTRFHPNVSKTETLLVFLDDAFRVVPLNYASDMTVVGVKLFRFEVDPKVFASADEYPDNAQFYQFAPSGTVNLTAMMEAPIFMSKPHFLDASPSYLAPFPDLNPKRELHDTYLGVEPQSGFVMDACERIMLSIAIEPIPSIFPNLPTVYCPSFWVERSGAITQDAADEFVSQVYLANDIMHWGPVVGFAVGAVVMVAGVVVLALAVRRRRVRRSQEMTSLEDQPLLH